MFQTPAKSQKKPRHFNIEQPCQNARKMVIWQTRDQYTRISQIVQGKYLTAGRNTAEADDRAADDAAAAGVTGADVKDAGGNTKPDADQITNDIFDQLEADAGFGPATVEA